MRCSRSRPGAGPSTTLTRFGARLEAAAPEPLAVTQAVEIESPSSHLEDRATKPALYAHYGIPHYWRIELEPPLVSVHSIGHGDCYQMTGAGPRLTVAEPLAADFAVADLLPRWAGRGEDPSVPEQG